jgi:hypothetical protein
MNTAEGFEVAGVLIHASSVKACVFKLALSNTLTNPLLPSKLNAWATIPGTKVTPPEGWPLLPS